MKNIYSSFSFSYSKILVFGLLVFLCTSGVGMAQLPTPVFDINSFIAISENTFEVKKQLDMLEETRKAIQKVSNAVRQITLIDDVITQQKDVVIQTQESINFLKDSQVFTAHEVRIIIRSFSDLIITSERTLSLANSILQDDFLEMTDAQRIELLMQLHQDVALVKTNVEMIDNEYRRVMQIRLLKKAFEKTP